VVSPVRSHAVFIRIQYTIGTARMGVVDVPMRRSERCATLSRMPSTHVPRRSSAIGPLELTGRSRAHVREDGGLTMQPVALAAFRKMCRAASSAGIDLAAASGFRDFDRQVLIWNQKWRGERALLDAAGRPIDATRLRPVPRARAILVWSAPPGASRHHWGSDVDVYDRAALGPDGRFGLVPSEYEPGGVFARLTEWLDQNMAAFGFYRPYVTDRGGVRPEPWHLSHVKTARDASRRLRLATLRRAIVESPIEGRATLLKMLPQVYQRYVRSVDPPPVLPARTKRRAVD